MILAMPLVGGGELVIGHLLSQPYCTKEKSRLISWLIMVKSSVNIHQIRYDIATYSFKLHGKSQGKSKGIH